MTTYSVELKTGCRIHFGLMEICPGADACFSGLGLALPEPGFQLELTAPASTQSSQKVRISGTPEAQTRILRVLDSYKAHNLETQGDLQLPAHIHVHQEIPLHTGLGAGTQLACATAAAIELLQHATASNLALAGTSVTPWQSVGSQLAKEKKDVGSWLTHNSGRGLRSAVGLRTFLEGGFVIDRGYKPDVTPQPERTLDTDCLRLPARWRVLILQNTSKASVAGDDETQKIAKAGKSPNANKSVMRKLVEAVAQSLAADDFNAFAEVLDRYMELAARLFEEQQGGLYNGPAITHTVESAKDVGLRAVGQSSWGPTVFGFAESEQVASEIKNRLAQLDEPIAAKICSPNFSGAEYRIHKS